MIRKTMSLFIVAILSALVISGCSGDKEENEENNENNENEEAIEPSEEENDEDDVDENEEENDEDENESNAHESSGDFTSLIEYMEETTDGTAEVLYENTEQQVHESDTITVTLNGYTLVELKDFHTNFSIPFGDETDGGVVIAEYTIENNDDQDAYYMTDFHIEYTGTSKFHNNYDSLLPEDVQIKKMLKPDTDYLIEAGESVTGYYAYAFSPEQLETIIELSTVTVKVNQPHNEKGDVNAKFGKEGQFILSLSEEAEKKAEANKAFYQDKATYENMGDKKMLKEKDNINMSEMLRDVEVTLDGYQFAEFTPNEVEAPRFSNFTNGIVLLTVKLIIDNGGDEEVDQGASIAKLTVNDGSQYLLNEGMLLNYRYGDVIEPGETDEILQVFVLDQEQYEKIWKDKSFELEIGPMRNHDAKDISKGNKISFTLPE